MKKRLLSLIMTVVMVASLSACGGGNNNKTNKNVKEPSTSETTESETDESETDESATDTQNVGPDISKEVVLKIYGVGNEGGKYSKEQMDAINKITKEKINATIEVNMISWGDFATKIPAILASGENFDLIFTSTWCNFKTEGPKGAFYELTPELLETCMPLTYAEYPEEAWQQASLGGKIYMIPSVFDEFESHGMLIRGDLRKKYDLPEVKTPEDLEAYFEAIKQNEPGMSPYKGTATDNIATMFTMFQNDNVVSGGVIRSGILAKYDDPNSANAAYCMDVTRPTYDRIRQWYVNGYIANDILSSKTTSSELFKTGQSATATTNLASATQLRKETLASNPDWEVEYVDFEGDTNVQRVAYNGSGMAVGRNAKNPERTLMFMELVYQNQELYDLIRYGVEGKNYILHEDGTTSAPEGVDVSDLEIANLWMGLRSSKFERIASDAWDVIVQKQEEYAKKAYDNKLAVMNYDLESVNAEIAALNNLYDQYEVPMKFGVVDPAKEYDKLMEMYKEAGIDKVVETVRQQIGEQLK